MKRNNQHCARGLALAALCGLSGCGGSFFSTRASNPVITDEQSRRLFDPAAYGIISTTAGRRSSFIRYHDASQAPGAERWLNQDLVCSEPLPDAVDALANAITLTASGSGGPSSPEAKASLANSLTVSSGLGLYRSQGLQLLRDQTFQLCIRAMETGMGKDEWSREQQSLVQTAKDLICQEMEAIKVAAGRTPMIVNPPSPFATTTVAAQPEAAESAQTPAGQTPATAHTRTPAASPRTAAPAQRGAATTTDPAGR